MNQKKIGQFIKERRKEKKLTQEELADKIRVSNRTISKWENGNSIPDYSIINDLCVALDVSVNELLSGEKINKDDYQKRFEENFLKTMKYNNKKINHSTIKIAIAFIIVLLVCLYFGYKAFVINELEIDNYKEFYKIYNNEENKSTYIKEDIKNDVEPNNKVSYNGYYDVEFYLDPEYKLTNDINEGAEILYDTYVKKENGEIVGTYQVDVYSGPITFDEISSNQVPYNSSLRIQKKYGIYNIVDFYEYYLNMKSVNIFSSLDEIRMYASAAGAFLGLYQNGTEVHGLRGDLYGLYGIYKYEEVDDDEKGYYSTDVYLYNLERNSRLEARITIDNISYNDFKEEVNNFIRSVKFQEGR